ncbi:unnamed protein product, partial [Ectocarpus sp. 12 AP-2014]
YSSSTAVSERFAKQLNHKSFNRDAASDRKLLRHQNVLASHVCASCSSIDYELLDSGALVGEAAAHNRHPSERDSRESMVRRRRTTCAVVGMLASTSVVATGPPSAWTGYPQQPRAPPQESDGARDASAAAARGWARSQSSRLREGAPRIEAEEESSPSSQPQSSASSSGGVGVVNNSGGGGDVDVAPRRITEQGDGGGGAIAAEDRNSSDRGGGKEERDGDGRLQQSPSSEEEAFLLEEGEGAGAPSMHVVKRDGRREPVMFDKITARIRRLCWGLDERYIDPVLVAQKVVQGIYSGVTTWELDTLAAETCAYMNTEHPHYARLAARISVSNLQRATSPSFADTVEELYAYVDPKTGRQAGYISDKV